MTEALATLQRTYRFRSVDGHGTGVILIASGAEVRAQVARDIRAQVKARVRELKAMMAGAIKVETSVEVDG